jgi:hypothetical protein
LLAPGSVLFRKKTTLYWTHAVVEGMLAQFNLTGNETEPIDLPERRIFNDSRYFLSSSIDNLCPNGSSIWDRAKLRVHVLATGSDSGPSLHRNAEVFCCVVLPHQRSSRIQLLDSQSQRTKAIFPVQVRWPCPKRLLSRYHIVTSFWC